MFIPYSSDHCSECRPWLAYLTFPAIVVAVFAMLNDGPVPELRSMRFMYFFEVSGFPFLIYLIGTLFVLWTFGRAICAKIGNLLYVVTVGLSAGLGIGLIAAFGEDTLWLLNWLVHGLAGMFLVFCPLNTVDYAIVVPPFRTFSLSGVWAVVLWLAGDTLFCIVFGWLIPLFVHPVSLVLGVVWATVLLRVHCVPEGLGDRTVWQWIRGENPEQELAWKDSWSRKRQDKLNRHEEKAEQILKEMEKEHLAKERMKQSPEAPAVLCQCGHIICASARDRKSVV